MKECHVDAMAKWLTNTSNAQLITDDGSENKGEVLDLIHSNHKPKLNASLRKKTFFFQILW